MSSQPPLPSLERALAEPPEVEGVRDESDLAGLARRTVRPIDLIGHSVAVVAPSASALVSPFLMLRFVGPGAWLSAVIGFGLAYLLCAVFAQFATRIAAPGSMYTWATRSLGPLVGLVVAASMLLGYGTLVSFGVTNGVRRGTDAATSSGLDPIGTGPELMWAVVAVVVCVLVSARGVALSTRVALAAEVLLVLSLVVLIVATLSREGLALGGLFSLEGAEPRRILLGASFIMSITVGFEASAALAGEAERPFLSVPRSLTATVTISAVLFALAYLAAHATLTQESGDLGGPVQRWFPDTVDAHIADAVLSSFLCVGYLALALCALNAVARVVFSLAREGLLPSWLGRTHPTWGTPVPALVAVVPLALAPPVVAAATGQPLGSVSGRLLGAAVLLLAIAYVVIAIAVPVLLIRLQEWTWWPVVLATLAAAMTLAVSVIDVEEDLHHRQFLSLALAATALVAGAVWYCLLRLRRTAVLQRIGLHDETISSDLLRP